MSGVDFLDSNVLIYTIDAAHPEKRATAKAIVADSIARQAAVISFQVVQETLDEARILVLPGEKFSVADAEALLANARTRIPAEVNVTVEIATRLERTPRGKTPLIVHRPPVHEALRRVGVEPMLTH